MTTPWIDRFAGLLRLEASLRDTLVARSSIVSVKAGSVIFGPGKSPQNLLLLLDGTVRVRQLSESGREIVLYRVEAGQSCVLTTACLLAHEDYSAEGVAETDVEGVAIPRSVFNDLMARSQGFRDFVFSAYSKRITELFRVIDEVAFGRIDMRLAQRLVALARGGTEVRSTHHELASELGTAREVISRQLQEFQRRGWITLARGSIELSNAAALSKLASSQGAT